LEYIEKFCIQGQKRRGIKALKLYSQISGNRLYEKKMKNKVEIEVKAKV